MPIQLPCDLAVPDFLKIEIADFVEWFLRCAFCVHRIQMPIDGFAVIQIFIPEKIKTVPAYFLCLLDNLSDFARQSLAQQFSHARHRVCVKKESPRSCGKIIYTVGEVETKSEQGGVVSFSGLLLRTKQQLFATNHP